MFKKIPNNKGVSLIELLVTVAIGLVVSGGIASVFVFAMQQFTILVEKNQAEEDSLRMNFYLRRYLSQAVDLNAVTTISTGAFGGGTGQIDVDFELLVPSSSDMAGAGDSGAFARFAIFNREAALFSTGTNQLPAAGSEMRQTGIFLKDTDADAPTPDRRAGAMIFDIGTPHGSQMVPNVSDVFLTRLHNFRVQRVVCNGVGGGYAVEVVNYATGHIEKCLSSTWAPGGQTFKVKTITLETFTRYFKTSNKDSWNFRAPVGGGNVGPYYDLVQTIKINFKNNALTNQSLTSGPNKEERVHGSVYFYDFFIPATQN